MAGSTDVIVLGAGVAGLAAAGVLAGRGLSVAIVEARARTGGRVHTTREALGPAPFELGAEFVHGAPEPLMGLARARHLRLLEVSGEHWRLQRGRLVRVRDFWAEIERALSGARLGGGDRAFLDAMRAGGLRGPAAALARSFVEGFHAADPARASARAIRAGASEGTARMYRLIDGYDGIVRALEARLPPERATLFTGTVATDVIWRKGRVEVQARGATGQSRDAFVARRAVITLPLGVLQAPTSERGAVRFDPGLTRKRRAVATLAMGSVLRLGIRFRHAFWTEQAGRGGPSLDALSFLHAPSDPIPVWWTAHPLREPVLTAWVGGPPADALRTPDERLLVGSALAVLARALRTDRPRLEALVEGWAFHDWTRDPYARGAYSYALVGGAGSARQLAAPVEGTLFFAGEATCPAPDNGTVHGALASGERAARELLRLEA